MSNSLLHVDLTAIAENFRRIRQSVRPTRVWAVVKGDAYGLGLEPVAAALAGAGADRFVVHNADEAARLRRAGVAGAILCLAASGGEELEALVADGVDVSVGSPDLLEDLLALAHGHTRPVLLHLEIDTGLGRGGFLPAELYGSAQRAGLAGVRVRGVWTHLASASDQVRSRAQLEEFNAATADLPSTVERHVANSAGLMLGREFLLDGIRPGLALYGLQPGLAVRPCISWTSRLITTVRRPSGFRVGYGAGTPLPRAGLVGIVPVGYADGYPRLNRGVASVRGMLAPILGPVSMNTMVLDLTHLPEAQPGDEVILIGSGGPSIDMLVERSDPAPVPNLFSCVRTSSTVRSYGDPGASPGPGGGG